jgi:hypothetical protein
VTLGYVRCFGRKCYLCLQDRNGYEYLWLYGKGMRFFRPQSKHPFYLSLLTHVASLRKDRLPHFPVDGHPETALGPEFSSCLVSLINRLTPNDPYMGRTAPLIPKRCILCIYSTNIGTEYFKHALYSPFFSLQNAVCFIMLTCLVPVIFTFCVQGVLKLKK